MARKSDCPFICLKWTVLAAMLVTHIAGWSQAQQPTATSTKATSTTSKRTAKPTAAKRNSDDWARATKSGTQEAYLAYATAHPNTNRLRILEGAVSTSGWVEGLEPPKQVRVTIGPYTAVGAYQGSTPEIVMVLDYGTAHNFGLMDYKVPEAPEGLVVTDNRGRYTFRIPKARILLTLGSDPEILAVKRLVNE